MLLRLFYLLSTLLFFTNQLRAQVYEPGFLVRSTGDTLRGEIENGFWDEPPTFIRYRSAANSASKIFSARQLRTISFTGGRYFRHEIISLDQVAETRLENLLHGSFIHMHADSVLAEVLLTGPIELLRVVRPGATHYEVRRPDRPPLSLSERKYLSQTQNGAWVVTDGNNYRNQLALYFIDCPAAGSAAQVAPFTAPGLVGVAQAYATSCTASQQPGRSWLAPAELRRRGAFQAGVLAGMRYNRIGSPSTMLTETSNAGHQLLPFGGLYAELLQPSRITAFYGELSVSSFRNQAMQSLGYTSQGNDQYVIYDYRGMLGTARIGVRFYQPLAHDQQLIFGLGFEYNKVWGLTTSGLNTSAYGYSYGPTSDNAYFPPPTLLPNLTLGWRQQRFTLSLDGQLYHANTEYDGFSELFFGSNWATRLGLSYRLGRNPDNVSAKLQH
jgi:hypothetical protein